jgi:phosphosulfolactate synthase
MLETLIEDRIDHKKPRHDGITYIIDKFQGLDKENFETISLILTWSRYMEHFLF